MLRNAKVIYFLKNSDSVFDFWQNRASTSHCFMSSNSSEILLTLCNSFGIFSYRHFNGVIENKLCAETTQDEMERCLPSKKS